MDNWTVKRRKDMVVKERNVRALVSWLLTNNEVLAQYLDQDTIGRLNKRLQHASQKTTDSECHSSTSKAVIQLVPRDKWQRIRARFYKDRDASSGNFTTIMLTKDVKTRLANEKKRSGYDSYSEVLDALLVFKAENTYDNVE